MALFTHSLFPSIPDCSSVNNDFFSENTVFSKVTHESMLLKKLTVWIKGGMSDLQQQHDLFSNRNVRAV